MASARQANQCEDHSCFKWGCHSCGVIAGKGPGSPEHDRKAARRRSAADAIVNLCTLMEVKPHAPFIDAVLQLGGAFFPSDDATPQDGSNTGAFEPDFDKAWKAASKACVEVVNGEHTYQPPQSPEQWKRALQAAYESGAFGAPARTA